MWGKENFYSHNFIQAICMTRNIWIGIIVVIVLVAGGWWYLNQSSVPATPETTQIPTTQNTNSGTKTNPAPVRQAPTPQTQATPQVQTQTQPLLVFVAPTISSTGDQILKPGAYEVGWKATGVNTLTIAVISESDGGSVVESGLIAASTGSYTIQIPEIPGSKVPPKYHFLISADNGSTATSNPFVLGCLACAPAGS